MMKLLPAPIVALAATFMSVGQYKKSELPPSASSGAGIP